MSLAHIKISGAYVQVPRPVVQVPCGLAGLPPLSQPSIPKLFPPWLEGPSFPLPQIKILHTRPRDVIASMKMSRHLQLTKALPHPRITVGFLPFRTIIFKADTPIPLGITKAFQKGTLLRIFGGKSTCRSSNSILAFYRTPLAPLSPTALPSLYKRKVSPSLVFPSLLECIALGFNPPPAPGAKSRKNGKYWCRWWGGEWL